jgi:hypothetical protein
VASCPNSAVISGDGANQSVTSGAAADVAGNTAAGVMVGGINIDGHAPQTTSNNVCTSKNNWCTGATATVALSATDIGPSGVKEIHYSVNGGPGHVESGSSYDVTIPLNGSGHATVTYYAVDNAGNVETPNTAALDYDNIAPTVTHTLAPDANSSGWNKADVTVHFSATDDDHGSGLDTTSVTPDVTVSSETSGQVITGHATDLAGNVGTDSLTVKLDKTVPTISGAIVAGTLGNNGWYTSPVKVHFTCADALSGIPSSGCPDDVTLSTNGSGQSVVRSVTDVAGNSASATVSGINIDATKPTINSVSVANGAVFTLGDPAAPSGTPTCTATDTGSGVASCNVAVTGGQPNGVGTFSFTATATDNAGNTSTQSGSYKVVYGWPGFLQPINDTAHQIGTSTSVFKAGSTVPVKFQLLRADGSIAAPSTTPSWITPLKGSAMTASIDETVYTDAPTSGSTYRYDATAQQWIYNWSTKGLQAGYFYRIGVTLDDGQTYYVSIGLR